MSAIESVGFRAPPDSPQPRQDPARPVLPSDAGDPADGGGAAKAYAQGKIGGFLTSTSGRRRWRSAPLRDAEARRLRHRHLPRARPRATPRGCRPARSWPSCSARRPAARRASADRCTSSTPRRTSSAATASSAATCRWRPASPSRRSTAATAGVTLCFFGDGAVPQGAFHEALALAALWKLPVVFICENNLVLDGHAALPITVGGGRVAKALGYGMARDRFDGDDVLAVRDRIAEAVRRARNESRRRSSRSCTYRFRGHSMSATPASTGPKKRSRSGRSAIRSRTGVSCWSARRSASKDIAAIEQSVAERSKRP